MPDDEAPGELPPAPDADALARLPADDWSILVRAAREALHSLDREVLHPRMVQLQATPTSKLMSGRSRQDLCRFLATRTLLWEETVTRLRDDPEALTGLDWLFAGTAPPQRRDQQPGDDGVDAGRLRTEINDLRERSRGFLDERDAARRRADGLEARLETERQRLQGLREEREHLRHERDELRTRLEETNQERRDALDRLQRRHDAEVAELRDELRTYRRREQERHQRQQRRRDRPSGERPRSPERRAREEIAAYRASRRGPGRSAVPARPSRLPDGVAPDTAEAANLLLAEGRRLLVDGYNVTQQHRGHVDLAQQRQWLLRVLEVFAARRQLQATVVFDGDATASGPGSPTRHTRVVFTEDESADDRLVALVAGLREDEPVAVVTDDRELRGRLAEYDVDLVGTRAFVAIVE